jgi:hypothetical protein
MLIGFLYLRVFQNILLPKIDQSGCSQLLFATPSLPLSKKILEVGSKGS